MCYLFCRQSVEVESQMTTVERILEYTSLEQEASLNVTSTVHPSTNWSSTNGIIFDNVSMKHLPNNATPLALKNISFVIKPWEMIGIVGRTGAGKTSIIQTMLRMGTLESGSVIIDNEDISKIDLHTVRQHISVIPQDPVLFSGTLRSNLDPFHRHSDVELWSALEQVSIVYDNE